MPHPSPLACTTAAPASQPSTQPNAPPPTTKRRGNPNLALIPRCGARTRAGCPCRAPAIHGKLRCRMHGGRSTGPRTKEGRARIAAARTTHGRYGADTRAFNRHHVTFLRRSSVRMGAVLYCDRLPPDLAARMTPLAPELLWPPRPTRGITRAEDRAMLQAETASLAPWKRAIAQARQTARPGRAEPAAPPGAMTTAQPKPQAPKPAADAAATASPASPALPPAAPPEPRAPIPLAPARAAPHQVPGSTGAPAAKLHAPNRAARRAGSASAPARLAAPPEPRAPIPPPPVQGAPDQAPASLRTAQAAQPHATERPGRGAITAPAPARLPTPPTPHAPNRIPTPHGASRTLPVGRAARRWLRGQKLMHQNQPAAALRGPRSSPC